MKVSKAIEMLSGHDPDEEIVIEWWDRNFIELDDNEGKSVAIPLDIWETVADGFEFGEYTYSSMFTELQEAIEEALAENNNKGEQQ